MPISSSHAPKRIALNGRAPSRRLLKACCRFGIGVTRKADLPARGHRLDALLGLAPGGVALVTGPSGSGKSRLMRELREAVPDAVLCDLASIYRCGSGAVIDLIPLPLERALRLLAAAGLADPFVLGRTVRELSVGERARFFLARALARRSRSSKARPGWLLIDEFLTTLDRETAKGVARSFRHAASVMTPRSRVIVATAHGDVEREFAPDVVVQLECELEKRKCQDFHHRDTEARRREKRVKSGDA
ncbi:MAG: AAA family ATPase [Phycisphaerales bacterium]